MAAGSTYTPIGTTTLGSAAADVTFSSISGYTDLVIVAFARYEGAGSGTGGLRVQFNSDSGTNYSLLALSGTGTSATSGRASSGTYGEIGEVPQTSVGTNTYSITTANVMNYASTSTYKTVISRTGEANNITRVIANVWRSTSAITSIRLFAGSNLSAGSTFTIYGITAA